MHILKSVFCYTFYTFLPDIAQGVVYYKISIYPYQSYYNKSESHKNNVGGEEGREAGTKEYILYDFVYMKL